MMHTPVNFPSLRMQMAPTSGEEIPEFWKANAESYSADANAMVLNLRRNALLSGNRISNQTFPPDTIYSTDTARLVQNWADLFMDSFDAKGRAAVSTGIASPTPPSKAVKYFEDAKALTLYAMRDIISQSTAMADGDRTPNFHRGRLASVMRREFEMVGLVPKDFEMPSLQSGTSAVHVPVLALGVFARDKIYDDRRGSLRKKIEEQYGARWARSWFGRPKRQFDVFSIEGLSEAPGEDLPEHSAKLLLTRMRQYARKERKVIVVPQWAYISRSGKDLTEYYERLGFEMVELEGQMHALIYTGTSSPFGDVVSVENQPIMVGMDFWTDI